MLQDSENIQTTYLIRLLNGRKRHLRRRFLKHVNGVRKVAPFSREVRQKAFSAMEGLIEDSKYTELSNSLVLGPIDDIRQSVLYIPSALLKEGKRQEAIGSRKAYTDYLRELKKLDALAQKAGRFEADEEDVKDSIGRLSLRLDDVLKYVP